MAQRTETELKVFLEGTLAQYNELTDTDKVGSVFFDKTNHAVYAKGECIIQSNIKDVTYNSTSTELTITPFTGTPIVINLGIQSELEGLETTLKTWVGSNYVAQSTFNNEIAKKVDKVEGKGLSTNDYTNADKTKLNGIDDNAQTNREVTVNGSPIGRDNEENQSTIKIKGNLVTAPNNGEDSEIEFYLSHKYYPTENKIRFFKTATPPDTYDETLHSSDVVLTIDTSDFVQAGMINNVVYNSVTGELEITFPTVQTDGTLKDTTVKVNLSKLVDVYKAGDGLTATVGDDGSTTFKAVLGDGLAFDNTRAITLSLGDGLKMVDGELVLDTTQVGVTGINGQGGGEYTINSGYLEVGDNSNVLKPINVVTNGKTIKIEANPKHIFAQFFHENDEDATSGIRAKGVKITEAADGNPYSMLMDFTPKVWSF